MTEQRADVAVVGGGILGLAHALVAARQGRSVVLFERGAQASGASVRNFGMVWPIGQPAGPLHELALRSRVLWQELLDDARLPYRPTGSLHAVHEEDEEAVAREFAERGPAQGYEVAFLEPEAALARGPALRQKRLRGALWSAVEMTVDPRAILRALPEYLAERWGVTLRYGTAVQEVQLPRVRAGREIWHVDRVVVCGGEDFETLYPETFAQSGLTRCKLQMLRTGSQPGGWQLGPSLAAGLTLRFYPAFQLCSTLQRLRERIAATMPEYDRWGIHVLVSQTTQGEVTIGDSHEYGLAVDIFDKPEVDRLILTYFDGFARLPSREIAQRWHGVYAKHPEQAYFTAVPEPGVRIVTGTGGSGMTLSFGLAERLWQEGAAA